MPTPRILAILAAADRYPHAEYAMEELLRRCAVARTIVPMGGDLPSFDEYDGIIFYGPQNVAPPQTDRPLLHILASSFFFERFTTKECIPEPPFAGHYPSPAFFNTPREFYAHRTLQNGEVMFDDYVASAYLCLSGHEEIVRPHLDEHQRHNGRSSFLFRGGVLERPLVEDYAAQFVEAFARLGLVIPPRPAWPNGSRMALCLTCDVDQPTRNTWKSVAKAALHRFPLFEDSGAQPSPMSYIPKKDMLDPYLELERFSRRGGIPDSAWTFFFLSGKRSKLDPYDLKEHLDLPYLARSLDEKGNEIALHAPYDCWRDPLSYVQAMDDFESATGGIRPVGVRQHYLRFRVPLTWNAQAGAKLQYDASAGFACCEGFRFGTALPFRAFDEDSKKTLDLWVIPLTVMDVTLRAYRKYTPQVAGARLRKLARETERVGGVFTFLWHNSSIGPGWENWEETFDTFLQSLAEKQVWAPTCSKLIKIWRQISEPQI